MFGVPLIILAAAGYFGYTKLIKPALDEKSGTAASAASNDKSTSGKKMIRVAGDPWSGYSTFRGEPRMAGMLGKQGLAIDYIDDEKLYDQNARMKALADGKIDIALTTVDAFLQHGIKHLKGGKYPGVILWGIDESNGGDAIFLAKGRNSFDDVKPTDKVCYSEGTPSEHLWDFASLSFANLGDSLSTDNGVVAKDCWDKLKAGKVQVAVLWQPFTAIAEKEGFPKVFATGGQADDVIVDIVVANRDYVVKEKDTLNKLANAYFATIDAYQKDTAGHGKFITKDCGPDCKGDNALGNAVLKGIDFLTYEENACLWWGMCGNAAKMPSRIRKTGRLLSAKGKIDADKLPRADSILNDSFLNGMKAKRQEKLRLAAEVAGDKTKVKKELKVEEKKYEYAAATKKDDKKSDVGTLRLPNIYFGSGSSNLDDNGRSVIDTIGDKLQSFPALCIHVYGHTNSLGAPSSNKQLSQERAETIVKYLKAKDGIAFPASRFDVRGFGSEQPILKDGAEDRNASRRTEFKLFNCDATTK